MISVVSQFYAIGYGNGRIWLGSDVGLVNAPSDFIRNNLYAVSNWNTLTVVDGLPGNSVRDIVSISSNNGLYVATNGGVANFDFSTFQRWPSSNSVINLFIANDQLYGATTRDVFAISETQSQTLYSVANTPITDFVVDSQGDIWVGVTKRGLQNLKSGEHVLMDGPLDNYIGETYVDSQNRLWCSARAVGRYPKSGCVPENRIRVEKFLFLWRHFQFVAICELLKPNF
ncbi:MAG: two-component regulator propeller domain-containing protein [Calditrichia bacterium]